MRIQLKTDILDTDIVALTQLYKSVGWNGHTPEKIACIYHKSTHIVFVYEENWLVGCGRALSDGAFNAAIYDVVVHPSHQHKGIGQRIVHQLVSSIGQVSCIHLISTLGNESFYERCGFKKLKTGMGIYYKPELKAQYLE